MINSGNYFSESGVVKVTVFGCNADMVALSIFELNRENETNYDEIGTGLFTEEEFEMILDDSQPNYRIEEDFECCCTDEGFESDWQWEEDNACFVCQNCRTCE